MTITFHPTTLYCDHTGGTDALLDGLSDGSLTPTEQARLYVLLNARHGIDTTAHLFNSEDVADYETMPTWDNTYLETWTCPVCDEAHRDERDEVAL